MSLSERVGKDDTAAAGWFVGASSALPPCS